MPIFKTLTFHYRLTLWLAPSWDKIYHRYKLNYSSHYYIPITWRICNQTSKISSILKANTYTIIVQLQVIYIIYHIYNKMRHVNILLLMDSTAPAENLRNYDSDNMVKRWLNICSVFVIERTPENLLGMYITKRCILLYSSFLSGIWFTNPCSIIFLYISTVF